MLLTKLIVKPENTRNAAETIAAKLIKHPYKNTGIQRDNTQITVYTYILTLLCIYMWQFWVCPATAMLGLNQKRNPVSIIFFISILFRKAFSENRIK